MALININPNTGQVDDMRITVADLIPDWKYGQEVAIRSTLTKYYLKAAKVVFYCMDNHGAGKEYIIKNRDGSFNEYPPIITDIKKDVLEAVRKTSSIITDIIEG